MDNAVECHRDWYFYDIYGSSGLRWGQRFSRAGPRKLRNIKHGLL